MVAGDDAVPTGSRRLSTGDACVDVAGAAGLGPADESTVVDAAIGFEVDAWRYPGLALLHVAAVALEHGAAVRRSPPTRTWNGRASATSGSDGSVSSRISSLSGIGVEVAAQDRRERGHRPASSCR